MSTERVIIASNYIGLNQPLTINCTATGFDFTGVTSYPCRLRNLSSGDEEEYDGSRSGQTVSFDIPGGVLSTAGKWRAIGGILKSGQTNETPCTPIEFTVSEC